MNRTIRNATCSAALALCSCALAAVPSAQQIVFDDFDRPPSTDLGPDWVEENGDLVIQDQQGKGNLFLANDTWMSHTVFSQTYANAKARVEFQAPGGELAGGVGVALGADPATWSAVAILLQDNDLDGLFDRVLFNAAINAGAWFDGGAPPFFDLPAPSPPES